MCPGMMCEAELGVQPGSTHGACIPSGLSSRMSCESCVAPGHGSFLLVGTYSPVKSISRSLWSRASLGLGGSAEPGHRNQTPREGTRNVAAHGEPLLSKEKQAVWADGFSKEEANPRGAAEQQKSACSGLWQQLLHPPSPPCLPGPPRLPRDDPSHRFPFGSRVSVGGAGCSIRPPLPLQNESRC